MVLYTLVCRACSPSDRRLFQWETLDREQPCPKCHGASRVKGIQELTQTSQNA
jgi:hypothetical protein